MVNCLDKQLDKIKKYTSDTDNKIYNNISTIISIYNITPKPILNITFNSIKLKYNDTNEKTYWEKGTGYGHNGNSKWDIKSFQKEQQDNKKLLLENIKVIVNNINKKLLDINVMKQFVVEFIKSMNIIEFMNNDSYYRYMLLLISQYIDNKYKFIITYYDNIFDFYNNISIIDEYKDMKEIQFIKNIKIKPNVISTDNKYTDMVKQYMYMEAKIPSNYKYNNIKDVIKTKSMIRILGELQTLKKSLPVNEDTSIILRYNKSNIQYASFFITGPKDTPYHNGIFEFHMRFPGNYPASNPLVNLMTTGNETVRFNPNLYNSGKVCLSLLGTWTGGEGESWNPSISTSLQVLISIQSLIFCEEPYFNEPGYERERGTKEGTYISKRYNEEKQVATIRWAINDMLKNPIESIKDFTYKHFSMKKEELINTTTKWIKDCSTQYKEEMIKEQKIMIGLLNNL